MLSAKLLAVSGEITPPCVLHPATACQILLVFNSPEAMKRPFTFPVPEHSCVLAAVCRGIEGHGAYKGREPVEQKHHCGFYDISSALLKALKRLR